jgi:hypothetical protein
MPVGEDEGKGEGESAADAACSLSRRHLLVDDGVLTADASPEGRAWLSARYPGLPQRPVCPRTLRAAILARPCGGKRWKAWAAACPNFPPAAC